LQLHGPARVRSRDELRENFFRLLLRSYLLAQKKGEGLAVYRSSAGMVHRLCGEPWAQQTIFPAESALVRRFLAQTELPAANADAIVQRSLMANPWVATWMKVLDRLDRRDFASLCSVSGKENLRAALATGRGVVLAHAHTLFVQLFWIWLRHEGIPPGVTIWQWAWGKKPEQILDPRTRALATARELHASMQSLREGGLVQILADGHNGNQQIELPFCNRRRGFRTTFAELALSANALVLPVLVSLAAEGSISIQIDPPFADAPLDHERGKRIESLVRQYADHLHGVWRTHAADIPWFQMKLHLGFAPI